MANRLRRNDLPEAWVAPPEVRELREMVRYRAKPVALRTSLKAQVHAVMAKCGILPTLDDMFSPAGQLLLDAMPLEGVWRPRVDSCRDLIDTVDDELEESSVQPPQPASWICAGSHAGLRTSCSSGRGPAGL